MWPVERCLSVLLLLTLPATRGDAQSAVFSLPPGRFAVGFKSVDLYDYSRTYRSRVTASGEREVHERARPVQTSIWYPARRGAAAPMRYGDYFAVGAHQEGPPTKAQVTAFLTNFEKSWLADGLSKADFDAIRRTPVRAVRDARPLPQRFPVVVYNAGGGQPSWDNSVLFEYLASHGYVVVASPSTWDWDRNRPAGDDYESVEAAGRDLEFHISYARQLPFADPDRLALMGYSWGGLASPIVALRNPDVAAVVGLDGSVTWADSLLARATHRGSSALRAAFLELHSSSERYDQMAAVRGEPADTAMHRLLTAVEQSFPFYAGIRYADAYNATMVRFHHGNFASHFTILTSDRKPGEPTMAEDQAGYAVMGRYVLTFLDGYVNGDTAARAWLRRPPHDNGIDSTLIRITGKSAVPIPAPTIEDFAAYARANGFPRLVALVDSVRRTDSTYTLPEYTAARWAEQLDDAARTQLSLEVRRWNVALHPKSVDALTSLCRSVTDASEAQTCWRNTLSLDPNNREAKNALEKGAS